jgi:hypothetical protein
MGTIRSKAVVAAAVALALAATGCAYGYGSEDETAEPPEVWNGYELKSPSSQPIEAKPTPPDPSPADVWQPPSRAPRGRGLPRPQ